LEGLVIQATVRGHRTPNGELWRPGQRVEIDSEPHGLQGTYFLLRRTFVRNRFGGTVTELELHEDETWVLDASQIGQEERDIAEQSAEKTEKEQKKAARRTARKSAQKAPKKTFEQIVMEEE
jgi:prophage tail gpP-like protein